LSFCLETGLLERQDINYIALGSQENCIDSLNLKGFPFKKLGNYRFKSFSVPFVLLPLDYIREDIGATHLIDEHLIARRNPRQTHQHPCKPEHKK
jgi:hypothetical protein